MYRTQINQVIEKSSKVLVLLGPRQVGKTTLLKNNFKDAAYINLEIFDYIEIFNTRDLKKIKNIILEKLKGHELICILDEIQRLDNPGLVAKIINDELPEIRLIISGSSALEISNRIYESLAGRKKIIHLFPLSFKEKMFQNNFINIEDKVKCINLNMNFDSENSNFNFKNEIKESMKYGMYPELLNIDENKDKEEYLRELVDSIILKDVFYLNLIKNHKNILSLLKLLAYQIGQQVNINDLSNRIGIARKTVIDYIELLEKSFIIYRLSPYTKKRRDEIGKREKIYFYDLGVRNAIINDFSPVEFRNDFGNMFENFVIIEILKMNTYYKSGYDMYYWRTKWGSEVDLILFKNEKFKAIEIKIRKGKITKTFKETYPNTEEYLYNLENIASLLLG